MVRVSTTNRVLFTIGIDFETPLRQHRQAIF